MANEPKPKPYKPIERTTKTGRIRVIDERGIAFTRQYHPPYMDNPKIVVNQGWRDAFVEAHAQVEGRCHVLLSYEMPNGREYRTIEDGSFDWVRTVNPKRPPAIWKAYFKEKV